MLATMKQTAEFVEFFRLHGIRQSFEKGDYIIHTDESLPGVFYISQGIVKAYDITKYNEENLLIIRKQDEIFPLIWAITGREIGITYQALAPTITWQVSRQLFLKFIKDNADALTPLLDMTMEMYRLHGDRIFNLEYRTVRERIISFLISTSERFGKETSEGLMIQVPLRHQDIASSINSSRETTSRELSSLERKGLIINKQSYTLIKDIAALRKHLN